MEERKTIFKKERLFAREKEKLMKEKELLKKKQRKKGNKRRRKEFGKERWIYGNILIRRRAERGKLKIA